MQKKRLDVLLVERCLVESREKAKALILAGDVLVDGTAAEHASQLVATSANIAIRQPPPYVSRAGLKLEHALREFYQDVDGLVVLDVGASTGGFTDCLLQHGVARVFAVDVGYGQLAWRVRSDSRVTVLDRTNIRHLHALPQTADAAVIDVSFISLKLVIPKVVELIKPDGWIIALIKPQFEAGRGQVGKGGVIRDPALHHLVLEAILTFAAQRGLGVRGLIASPILGHSGNKEFLVHLTKRAEARQPSSPDLTTLSQLIDAALSSAQ